MTWLDWLLFPVAMLGILIYGTLAWLTLLYFWDRIKDWLS